MTIVEHLQKKEKTRFSFELLPPLKGHNIKSLYETIDPLMEFNPLNINITYHREETIYKRNKNGLLEQKTISKRPGTVAISAAIKHKYKNIDVVPHITCGGFSKEDIENTLIDLHFLGINNLLVLRGDPEVSHKIFTPEENGHSHASDLVKQVTKMNNGVYLDDDLTTPTPTNFNIGVAGYPEKHSEAPNMSQDIEYLKQKVDAGAQYIVTQMFFDNEKFFNFVELCKKNNINVPIIPGLKPISIKNHINILPQIFHIDLPDELVHEISKCKNNVEVREVGVQWAIKQSKELIKFGVPTLHYYTMGKSDNICKIAKELF